MKFKLFSRWFRLRRQRRRREQDRAYWEDINRVLHANGRK